MPQTAIPPGEGSQLDELIAGPEAAHPGESGLRLIKQGPEAFAVRARSALLAARSLDVQTYIWHADLTGMYLAHRLLEAADRGVRVRMLVDDMDARAKNAGFAGLDAHPNIQVQMFNPFSTRKGLLRQFAEMAVNFDRLNHRMHNKTWIADNRIAVVGGRNLGDEYFGASEEVNFVDLDFAMVGPIVRDASASFDTYWNAETTRTMRELDPERVNKQELERVRGLLGAKAAEGENSRYAEEHRRDNAVQRLIAGDWPMEWTDVSRFVVDDPGKVTMNKDALERSHVRTLLVPAVQSARKTVTLISPYFVPNEMGTRLLVDAARAGKRVRVLTNSLVANDVAAVHGGYSKWRRELLAGGVELWELKPLLGSEVQSSLLGSRGASLHTKALAVDGDSLFVGSFNIDPRSTWLNCEQGILAQSIELARQLEDIFDSQSSGVRAWKVTLADGNLHWSDGREGFDREPNADAWRRFQAWITQVLGLDAQL
jgi:putative cardiolipin synthase